MLTIYRIGKGVLEQINESDIEPGGDEKYWFDLQDPTADDRRRIEKARGIHLPLATDVAEIEATSRFFSDDDSVHMRVWFLDQEGDDVVRHPVAFVLTKNCLVSVAWGRIGVFDALRASSKTGRNSDRPEVVMFRLLELHLDKMADFLERYYDQIEMHWHWHDGVSQEELDVQMKQIVQLSNNKHKVRFVLMDLQQVMSGLQREGLVPRSLKNRFLGLQRDLSSLLQHSDFVSEKLDFLMNMLISRLTLIDNRVGKILSIVALVFLPPTLIAAIYGMNFQHMPELQLPWAYPAALVAMLVSAVVPYLIFKWKRWL